MELGHRHTAVNYNFYDEWIDTLYKEEQHAAYIIRVFAILSILLTCLGTFGVIHFVLLPCLAQYPFLMPNKFLRPKRHRMV